MRTGRKHNITPGRQKSTRETVPLNHRLSAAGACSRRRAADLVRAGRVSVNGCRELKPCARVGPGDEIRVDGQPLETPAPVHLALNKPPGYTCTLADRHADKKIGCLVPSSFGRVYPAGRLDRDSRGLIILTNDGAFAHRLTHPSFGVEKEYRVTLSPGRPPSREQLRRMVAGISDRGETLRALRVSRAGAREQGPAVLEVVLVEGRKREIRRMCRALGLKVSDLVRVRIGGLVLGTLPEGRCRRLSAAETAACLAQGTGNQSGKSRKFLPSRGVSRPARPGGQ